MPKARTVAQSYEFPLDSFVAPDRFARLKTLVAPEETPCLVLDLGTIRARYEELGREMPFARIYFPVEANPHREVLSLLRDLGSRFAVASRFELDLALGLGVSPDRVLFGNTVKKRKDTAYAFERGVRLFATDSMTDLAAISSAAPGSKVFFRLLTDGLGADRPVSKKSGCQPDLVRQLVKTAVRFGLEPYGLAFSQGGQQRDVGQWSSALATVGQMFRSVREEIGVDLKMLDMGEGLPANYLEPSDPVAEYAQNIERFLGNSFKDGLPPEIFIEPGRFLAADAGVIVSEIVNIARKSVHERYTWVFLDVGKFGGLIETQGEAIKYPICFEGGGRAVEIILAGPTCDSMDILYERWTYHMPESARIGDRVYIFTAGAYTQSLSSVYFNGFPPLAVLVMR